MEFEVVIGLEVHIELATKTKIFCSCKNEFGAAPNTNCCPVCLALPGALPVLNKKVVEFGIKAGHALNCEIPEFSKMDRKGYFYPDLPKAYQISQFDYPLCKQGYVDVPMEDYVRRVGITRIHIEEDAGKLVHDGFGGDSGVDLNRCGVPLIEIVTEPDLRSAQEVKEFLETLKANIEYVGISDCKMQEGSMRCDINISVREKGATTYGTRTELKNINSISAAIRAIEYESRRHMECVEDGEEIIQETRRWDDGKGKTFPMRDKEEAHDYRYFPDPDLVPIVVTKQQIQAWKDEMPEMPKQRKERFIQQYDIPAYDAGILTSSKYLADFFEGCTTLGAAPKAVSNFIMSDVLRLLKEMDLEPKDLSVAPERLVEVLKLIDDKVVSTTVGKQVFEEAFKTGKTAAEIVEEKGLKQINDDSAIRQIVAEVIAENPKPANDFKGGNPKALTAYVGKVMKATKGKANPQLVNQLVREEVDKL